MGLVQNVPYDLGRAMLSRFFCCYLDINVVDFIAGPSIKRFPADGSSYAGVLTNFKSIDIDPNRTRLIVAARSVNISNSCKI